MDLRRSRRTGILLATALLIASLVTGAPMAEEPGESPDPIARRGDVYGHLMRSLFAARSGDEKNAVREIKKAVELSPDEPAVYLEGAELLRWMGRENEAEELARRGLALDPEHVGTIRLVADLAASRASRDPESQREALELYQKLLDSGDADPEMLQRLAGLKLRSGDRDGAMAVVEELVRQRPGDRSATGMLAQLLLEDGREIEALRVLAEYIAKHPDETILTGLTEELAQQTEGWSSVVEVMSAHPEFIERVSPGQRLYGLALVQTQDFGRAVPSLERALRFDDEDSTVRFELARAYRLRNRLADSAAACRRLAEDAPDDPRARLLLGEVLDDQSDKRGALRSFRGALRIYEEGGNVDNALIRDIIRRRLARLYLDMEQPAEAASLLSSMEQPADAETEQLTARMAIVQQDWTLARAVAERLRSGGEEGKAALIEAEVLIRTGKHARADAKVSEALGEEGPYQRVLIAQIYRELEMPEHGLRLLRAWVEGDAERADAHYYLGSYLYQIDRFDEAESSLRAAFGLEPAHAPALNFLGYSLAERGERLEEALDLIEQALVVDGANGAYLDSLGWVYYQMGNFEAALDPLERAAREFPLDPTVLEHLGDLYMKLGDFDLALQAWDRALAADPEDEAALQKKISLARSSVGSSPVEVRPRDRLERSPDTLPR